MFVALFAFEPEAAVAVEAAAADEEAAADAPLYPYPAANAV